MIGDSLTLGIVSWYDSGSAGKWAFLHVPTFETICPRVLPTHNGAVGKSYNTLACVASATFASSGYALSSFLKQSSLFFVAFDIVNTNVGNLELRSSLTSSPPAEPCAADLPRQF